MAAGVNMLLHVRHVAGETTREPFGKAVETVGFGRWGDSHAVEAESAGEIFNVFGERHVGFYLTAHYSAAQTRRVSARSRSLEGGPGVASGEVTEAGNAMSRI